VVRFTSPNVPPAIPPAVRALEDIWRLTGGLPRQTPNWCECSATRCDTVVPAGTMLQASIQWG